MVIIRAKNLKEKIDLFIKVLFNSYIFIKYLIRLLMKMVMVCFLKMKYLNYAKFVYLNT